MACIPILILLSLSSFCKSDDQLTYAKPLASGETLVSKGGDFALGFFSPTNSNSSLYLGIWYHSIPNHTVVWIANRNKPITSSVSPKLAITNTSGLILSDSQGQTVWATNNKITAGVTGVAAVILDTGNLVLRSSNGTVIWQSFDHPTDTLLPGMSITVGGGTYRSNTTSIFYQTAADVGDEYCYVYTVSDGSPYVRAMLDYTGKMKTLSWSNSLSSWTVIGEVPTACDFYSSCGSFSYCDFTATVHTCQCLDGYEIDGLDFSRGCQRMEPLKCGKPNHFVALPVMKVPANFLHIKNRSFDQCTAECSSNCSCTAYAYANLSSDGTFEDPSRCLVWTGELVDTWKFSNNGENLYLRLADSPDQKNNLVKVVPPIIASLAILTCTAFVTVCIYRGKWRNKEIEQRQMLRYVSSSNEIGGEYVGFPFVSFQDIATATDNFSDSNQIGRGGFGKVYKGLLEGGKEVAVKRLSEGSRQGIAEFKNEIVLFAKLQHKNLVRLLGCSIHGDERLLIYEYLPNKSLDVFLFGAARQSVLDWPTRFKIIKGVARGLLYLHQDSRLTIIHRDLKASNVLLDTKMNAKISDFGMARIFGENQQHAKTTRVVGTYGYMSPEYVMGGAFSVKSDTYSFGVLLLEIVSGFKISSSELMTNFSNLIAYAWRLWEDGKAAELVECSVRERCPLEEALRCIHVGLLCVQNYPDDRPLMSSVIFMLENGSALVPAPKKPAYYALGNREVAETTEQMENSANGISITTLDGR
ncbi:receptor-like serine/threonine-protein kinase SD1-8 isoform X2 [Hordeum vulgare subsp. vulgare]|uniref:receptor-like serine/threonine-protein kinase SD1-8 isoform X2 n=1 Tax=Hordeum vulgare subsp. vulgare TaxID=112509 RepID=UPI001B859A6F|nr:receptor-like serine/threonine-protein kinase SD1-8 isoform X2 [Hordeum vulgare subsp. vulgare]